MIIKDNYEAWLLQYHDGTLDKQTANAVEEFLRLHPHIAQEDMLYYSDVPLVPSLGNTYLYKGFLKQRPTNRHRWWYWAVAACMAGVLVTVWLWNAQLQPQTLVAQKATVDAEVWMPIADTDNWESTVEATAPMTHATYAQVRKPQPCCDSATDNELKVAPEYEEATVSTLQPNSLAPIQIKSDQLVVYGCPTINSSSLVRCPEEQPTCNNLACRLILTGQRLGML